jgi:hypothetical protein
MTSRTAPHETNGGSRPAPGGCAFDRAGEGGRVGGGGHAGPYGGRVPTAVAGSLVRPDVVPRRRGRQETPGRDLGQGGRRPWLRTRFRSSGRLREVSADRGAFQHERRGRRPGKRPGGAGPRARGRSDGRVGGWAVRVLPPAQARTYPYGPTFGSPGARASGAGRLGHDNTPRGGGRWRAPGRPRRRQLEARAALVPPPEASHGVDRRRGRAGGRRATGGT